jgi:hypothetical protein
MHTTHKSIQNKKSSNLNSNVECQGFVFVFLTQKQGLLIFNVNKSLKKFGNYINEVLNSHLINQTIANAKIPPSRSL